MRTVAAPEQLDEMAQPSLFARLAEIGVDRVPDLGKLVDVRAAGQQRHPIDQELAVGRIVLHLQRGETRSSAGAQQGVAPPDRAQEGLRTAILVEEDDARREFAALREQEVEHHRLARARGPDQGEVAEIAVVEVEVIGAGGGGLEQSHRVSPMVSRRLALRQVVAIGETGEIRGGDQPAPGDIFEVPG
ncbi:hypothetical protein QU38_02530, partial [Staphylococcus aureus]